MWGKLVSSQKGYFQLKDNHITLGANGNKKILNHGLDSVHCSIIREENKEDGKFSIHLQNHSKKGTYINGTKYTNHSKRRLKDKRMLSLF